VAELVIPILDPDIAAERYAPRQWAARSAPRGTKTVLMGDSITAYNGGKSTATPSQALPASNGSAGIMRWANVMLGQQLDIIGNSGIGGQNTTQIRARFVTDVLSLSPDIVALLAGTNDAATAMTADATWANLAAMYADALDAGIHVIAFTIPPATAGTAGAVRQDVNTRIRTFARRTPGITLVDLADAWQDKPASGFAAKSAYLIDGVHPGTLGAMIGGRKAAEAIAPVMPRTLRVAPSIAAPDNCLANARFAGTGTTAPTSWGISGTATYAYLPRADGKPGQRLAITVPTGGAVSMIQNVAVGPLLAVGESYDFSIAFEAYDLDIAATGAQIVTASTQQYTGASFVQKVSDVYWDSGANYGSARYPMAEGAFAVPAATVVAGITLVQVVVSLNGGGTYVLKDPVFRNLTKIATGATPPAGNQAPTAAFTFSTADLAASFNAGTSTDSDGTIATYAWNFGDGSTGSGATATRTYATAGTYTVALTVTDNGGASATTTKTVTVAVAAPHTNLVANGTFESSVTGWSGANASVARSTTEFHSGTGSLAVTYAANATGDARTANIPIAAKRVDFDLWAKAPAGFNLKVLAHWFAAGSAYAGNSTPVNITATGAWQRLTAYIEPPATAVEMLVALTRGAPEAGTPVVYFDDVDVWQP
jgi:PKD repeat protein